MKPEAIQEAIQFVILFILGCLFIWWRYVDTMKLQDLSLDARKVTLYLRLEVGYALDEDIAERIVYHATKLELAVACQLDKPKYEMIAYPGETAAQVLERLHEHRKIIREGQS